MKKVESIQNRAAALDRFCKELPRLKIPDPIYHVDDRQMKYYREFSKLRMEFVGKALEIIEAQVALDNAKLDAIEELLSGDEK